MAEQSSSKAAPASGATSGAPDVDHLVGRDVAGHRILGRIGEGGMGVVYAARPHAQPVGAPEVVVKVLRPVIAADPTMVARLFNELRATERVAHPGVVRVHSCGEAPGVGPYVIMERLEGECLADLIKRRGPLPVEEAVRLCCAISDVLGAAHHGGIVHRDLKPENVFVSPPGAVTALKVLDFGMALVPDESSPRMTQSFQTFGTPLYMSPEQCASAKQVDHRTDIYALGVIAFELISGRPPFEAEGTGRLLAMHQYEPAPRLDKLARSCAPAVADVIEQALAKQPEGRFDSAGAFARALVHALSDTRRGALPLGETLPPNTPRAGGATLEPTLPPSPADASSPAAFAPTGVQRPASAAIEAAPESARIDGRPRRRRMWLPILIVLGALSGAAAASYLIFSGHASDQASNKDDRSAGIATTPPPTGTPAPTPPASTPQPPTPRAPAPRTAARGSAQPPVKPPAVTPAPTPTKARPKKRRRKRQHRASATASTPPPTTTHAMILSRGNVTLRSVQAPSPLIPQIKRWLAGEPLRSVARCYAELRKTNPSAGGQSGMTLTLRADRAVVHSGVWPRGRGLSPISGCLRRAIASWRAPSLSGRSSVEIRTIWAFTAPRKKSKSSPRAASPTHGRVHGTITKLAADKYRPVAQRYLLRVLQPAALRCHRSLNYRARTTIDIRFRFYGSGRSVSCFADRPSRVGPSLLVRKLGGCLKKTIDRTCARHLLRAAKVVFVYTRWTFRP